MASCKCGGRACNCVITAGPGITVVGGGSTSNPYVVGASAPEVGCGLTGKGTEAEPLAVETGTWPYSCDIASNGGVISCDPSTGQLYGEPRTKTAFQSHFETRTFPDLPVPLPDDTPVATFCASITNPDTCRAALVVITQETDAYFTLPPGAEAAAGQNTDEMWRIKNTGSTQMPSAHLQFSKLQRATVGAGATLNWCYDVTMAHGSGGATYHQILSNIRFHLISL